MNEHDPTPIFQMMNAVQATAILKTAVELDIFSALAAGPATAEEVAGRVRCPARAVEILLDALSVTNLLTRGDGRSARYELVPVSREFLVRGGPTYMGDLVEIFGSPMLLDGYVHLTDAVRAGGSVMEQHGETPQHPFWETFARTSAALAVPAANHFASLAKTLVTKPAPRVLDVAAGSGIYGYTLAKALGASVTFLDWPNVLDETRAWAPRLGVDATKASYIGGSAFDADLGGEYDLIVVSHLFHHFDANACQKLMRRVAGAVTPGGYLCVHEFMTGSGLENPAATMFSLNMLVFTRGGKAYSRGDYTSWMRESGLRDPAVHDVAGMPSSWIVAKRG